MKSLAELQAIRDRVKDNLNMRTGEKDMRIVVGMATCGIAAGARPVLAAFVEGIENAELTNKVIVTQTGCIGICKHEPVVEVFESGKEKVTYIKMTAERVQRVIEEHVKNGKVVTEYTIGAAEK